MTSVDRPGTLDLIDLSTTPTFQLSGLTITPAIREVAAGEDRETLEPRVMQALVALARSKGEVVSRDHLIELCWGGRIVGDDAINGAVAKVRRLGEAHQAFTIETIPRVGYRLLDLAPPAGAVAGTKGRPSSRFLILAAVFILAISAGVTGWLLRGPPTVRVAVQPFEAGPSDQALANRVRDQVAGVLSARLVDVTAKGQERGAWLQVSGAVERAGGLALVRVRLEDSRSGLSLWSAEVSGPDAADSPVAERTAAKAGDLIFDAVRVLRSSRGSVTPEAMKAFMLGLESWRELRTLQAVNYYRVFRDKAPGIAESHGVYAFALAVAAENQSPEVAAAWRQEARQSADRALAIDSGEAAALRTKVWLIPPKDFSARLEIVGRGLKQNPNNVDLLSDEGLALSVLGRPREGLSFLRRSLVLDPLSPRKNFRLAISLGMVGRTNEARSVLVNSQRIWPDSPDVIDDFTLFAVDFAEPDEGLRIVETLIAGNPAYGPQGAIWRSYLQSLQCQCGQASVAQVLRREILAGRLNFGTAYPALVRLGRIEDALEALNVHELDQVSRRMLFADVTAPMRRDPRFMDLTARLGLAPYWLTSDQWPEFCAEPGLPYDCKVEAARAVAKLKAS